MLLRYLWKKMSILIDGDIHQHAYDLLDMDFSDASKAKQIYPIVSLVRNMFACKDYSSVDYYLDSINWDKMSVTAMVCVIRTTFAARHDLSRWYDTRDLITEILHDRMPDEADSIMHGLY